MGLDRLMLVLLIDLYNEELVLENDVRIVLKVLNVVVLYKFVILFLVKKLNEKVEEIYK